MDMEPRRIMKWSTTSALIAGLLAIPATMRSMEVSAYACPSDSSGGVVAESPRTSDDSCWSLEMQMEYPSKYGFNDIRWLGKFTVDDEGNIRGSGRGEIRHWGPCVILKGGFSPFNFIIGGRQNPDTAADGSARWLEFKLEDQVDDTRSDVDPNAPMECVLLGPLEAFAMLLQGGFYPSSVYAKREDNKHSLYNAAGIPLRLWVRRKPCDWTIPDAIPITGEELEEWRTWDEKNLDDWKEWEKARKQE